MAEAARLLVRIGADVAPLEKGLKQAQADLRRFKATLSEVRAAGLALVAASGALAAGLGFAAKAAAEEEAADKRLIATLRNVGVAFAAVEGPVRAFIAAQERATGFNDTELQGSFSRLVQLTRSVSASYRLTALAADVARGAQVDLSTATEAVGRAAAGNFKALRQLVPAIQETDTNVQALTKTQAVFGGLAAEHMTGAAGAWANFRNQLDNVVEGFGAALLPVVTRALRVLGELSAAVAALPGPFRTVVTGAAATAAALGLAAGAALLFIGRLPALIQGLALLRGALAALSTSLLGPAGLVVGLGLAAVAVAAFFGAFSSGREAKIAQLQERIRGLQAELSAGGLDPQRLRDLTRELDLAMKGLAALGGQAEAAAPALGQMGEGLVIVGGQAEGLRQIVTDLKTATRAAGTEFQLFGDLTRLLKAELAAAEAALAAFTGKGLTEADPRVQAVAEKIRTLRLELAKLTDEARKAKDLDEAVRGAFEAENAPAAGDFFPETRKELTLLQSVAQQTAESFSRGFADAFADAIVQGKNFVQSMKALLKSLGADIIRTIVQSQVSRALAGLIPGAGGAGAAGGALTAGSSLAALGVVAGIGAGIGVGSQFSGGQTGATIGSLGGAAIGGAFFGPLGGAVGGFLGGVIGGGIGSLVGGKRARRKTRRVKNRSRIAAELAAIGADPGLVEAFEGTLGEFGAGGGFDTARGLIAIAREASLRGDEATRALSLRLSPAAQGEARTRAGGVTGGIAGLAAGAREAERILTNAGESILKEFQKLDAFFQGLTRTLAAVGEALGQGVVGAVRGAIQGFLTEGASIFNALKTGVRGAIEAAITEAIVQGAIIQGALGALLTQLTQALVTGAGDPRAIIAQIAAALPDLAAQIEALLAPLRDALQTSLPMAPPPGVSLVPAMAGGGVVTRPTLTLLGEAGPEAVVPLGRRGGAAGSSTVIVELDGRAIAKAVVPWIPGEVRVVTGVGRR